MPVATVGLFVLAIVVIVLAFAIQHFAGGDGGSSLTAAERFATTQAVNGTANAGKQTQPAGTATVAANQTAGAGTATGNKTPTAGGSTTTAAAGGGAKTYTVKSGDICSTIASDNGITLQQLEDVNGLTDDSCRELKIGQVLKLP
jgi:LysM repeat protein